MEQRANTAVGNEIENPLASRMVLARLGNVVVRPMRHDQRDYRLMARWLSDHRVLKWYEGRDNVFSYDMVVAKFSPRVLAHDYVRPCIIELESTTGASAQQPSDPSEASAQQPSDPSGANAQQPSDPSKPIGYIQYYPVAAAADYELDDATDTWGFDLFIGEPRYWGSGAGTGALAALVAHVFERENARRCVIDPRVANPRAIRSYEKVGFRKVKVMKSREDHEGARRDNWLMLLERERFESQRPPGAAFYAGM